jgi:hypothetical protein
MDISFLIRRDNISSILLSLLRNPLYSFHDVTQVIDPLQRLNLIPPMSTRCFVDLAIAFGAYHRLKSSFSAPFGLSTLLELIQAAARAASRFCCSSSLAPTDGNSRNISCLLILHEDLVSCYYSKSFDFERRFTTFQNVWVMFCSFGRCSRIGCRALGFTSGCTTIGFGT